MPFRFLDKGGRQLRMTHHFLSDGVQEIVALSQFYAIHELDCTSKEEDCRFRWDAGIYSSQT